MKLLLLPLFLGAAVAAPLVCAPVVAQTAPVPNPQARPFLNALFSDDAVLQRDRVIPVWGWTAPGQIVTVKVDAQTTTAQAVTGKTVAGKTATARADATGRWTAHIGPFAAGGPHTLSVSSARPGEAITRRNVLFGDVWLCSGQSNMEFGVGNLTDADAVISAANYPQLRLFTVPKVTATAPLDNADSRWLECNPTNIKQGNWNGFSAVAYFFGRKLNQQLGVPIGLLHSSWGGTVGEAWVSESSLGTLPDFRDAIAASKTSNEPMILASETNINDWLAKYDPTIPTNWAAPQADDAAWPTMQLPTYLENSGVPELANFDGSVLFRRQVEVPANWAGQNLTLDLGAIDDNDVTYWNGARVGATNGYNVSRSYVIPGAQVKAGRNVVAVRVTDSGSGGGMYGPAAEMKLVKAGANSIALDGAWNYHIGAPLSKMSAMPKEFDPNDPNRVDVLYNGMIAPLAPFALKGAIWYQGESNSGRAEQYGRLLPTLIGDWRQSFAGPLPFYIVQLAGFMAPDEQPRDDGWVRLRDAQLKTARTVPNTGIAITTDIGDEKDIHPKNKEDVGVRLALAALAQTYGQKVEYSGPMLQAATPQGDTLALTFDHAGGGLRLQGDAARVFAVAGADMNWSWATPRIEGNRVILSSPAVPTPLYARYAWSNLPRATLYNGANLPAPPFQTP